jgi:hypothetical protein
MKKEGIGTKFGEDDMKGDFDRYICGNSSRNLEWVINLMNKKFPYLKISTFDLSGFFGTTLMKGLAIFQVKI